ncbi:MAG: UDP-N-acetylglucosamine 2-epimerase (hydrolyzing) [Candidatus Yanofskybacteria bacterium]|nr:UDP-N-acetylglucosamine 2-epimerase (hydrolyzing) [Candidatus Yanofskybacteria bacterium]
MILKNKKKIAYISGTRADFGLMTPILKAISRSKQLDLQVYAAGTHLMPEFGETVQYVRKEFPNAINIEARFETGDRPGMTKFTGVFLSRLVGAFSKNRPDFVLTLGDRPEMLCTAMACLYLGIPTGHVHGGDKTSTVDELARHAITKLSHIHFPAIQESADRIQKMGEEKWRIHIVGAPALDVILNEKLPTKKEFFKKLNLDPSKNVILVTQHPVSEEVENAGLQMEETLAAVKKFNLPVVITYPHADAGGRKIISVIEKEKNNPLFHIFPSLEYKQFLALERETAVWVGNSSGAIIESSSFQTPVVNVGTRQTGRQRGANVIDVGYNKKEIEKAVYKSINDQAYLKRLKKIKNPWGDGKTGPRVAKILENININSRLLTKQITY